MDQFNEIAEQCGFDSTPENPVLSLTQDDLQYYGECIVKECIQICEDMGEYEVAEKIYRRFGIR